VDVTRDVVVISRAVLQAVTLNVVVVGRAVLQAVTLNVVVVGRAVLQAVTLDVLVIGRTMTQLVTLGVFVDLVLGHLDSSALAPVPMTGRFTACCGSTRLSVGSVTLLLSSC
jgi:hypothetical protein